MRTKHLFESHIYLIENHAVALNPLFQSDYYSKRFMDKVSFYLSPIVKILAYSFDDDQFQLLVKLKSRCDFESYYLEKKKGKKKLQKSDVPQSTYIFSQCMANLQSSMAIHFNRREGRSGALFAKRFSRELIETGSMYVEVKEKLEKMQKLHEFNLRWRNKFRAPERIVWVDRQVRKSFRSSFYRGKGSMNSLEHLSKTELQGQFLNLPPKQLSANLTRKIPKIKLPIQDLL